MTSSNDFSEDRLVEQPAIEPFNQRGCEAPLGTSGTAIDDDHSNVK